MATRYIIVIDQEKDWKWPREGFDILTVDAYLKLGAAPFPRPSARRVINLCRHYSYLDGGYYCSLLAEARLETPLPTMADMLDLSHKSLYNFVLPELDNALLKGKKTEDDDPENYFVHVFFGQVQDKDYASLGRQLFDIFRFPLLKVDIHNQKGVRKVESVRPLGVHQIGREERPFFLESLSHFTRLPSRRKPMRTQPLYDLAILHNPQEAFPPSNPAALQRFIKAGRALRMDVALISVRDFYRIPQFDALFLRETTATNNYTFRFARKAEQEGLPVLDDTSSIIRCANKVYLHELLDFHRVSTPKTRILDRRRFSADNLDELESILGYPIILKVPDGSFSRGVFKVKDRSTLMKSAETLFAHSRLILAQEYMYTSFDWRIGILGGRPIFASKYMMSGKHWQIYHHRPDGTTECGGFQTLPIEATPPEVVETARRAASLVGNGLYGVDLKQNDKGVFVIEVNDNPNIDHGIEDKVLKEDLYTFILKDFIHRIENNTGLQSP